MRAGIIPLQTLPQILVADAERRHDAALRRRNPVAGVRDLDRERAAIERPTAAMAPLRTWTSAPGMSPKPVSIVSTYALRMMKSVGCATRAPRACESAGRSGTSPPSAPIASAPVNISRRLSALLTLIARTPS